MKIVNFFFWVNSVALYQKHPLYSNFKRDSNLIGHTYLNKRQIKREGNGLGIQNDLTQIHHSIIVCMVRTCKEHIISRMK